MSAQEAHNDDMNEHEHDDEMFNPEDMEEEFEGEGEDMPMSDDDDEEGGAMEEIMLQNDSIAHFDGHKDSIFCIAQHPTHPQLVATGGGDDVAFLWDCSPPQNPVLPASYESNPQPVERNGQQVFVKLQGHTDSVNAVAFSLPDGKYVATAGLDGRLNIYLTPLQPQPEPAKPIASAAEVDEINWLLPCPNPAYPNTFALGANDGSVWVYSVTDQDLSIVQAFYLHQASCTAGAWTPDGKLLCTVSEESSLYVWDVFGLAAAAGLSTPSSGQAVVALTGHDERFLVEGGFFSVASRWRPCRCRRRRRPDSRHRLTSSVHSSRPRRSRPRQNSRWKAICRSWRSVQHHHHRFSRPIRRHSCRSRRPVRWH
jgi:ribosome assembly protein SQT1